MSIFPTKGVAGLLYFLLFLYLFFHRASFLSKPSRPWWVSAPSFYSPNDTFDVRDACLHHLSILQMILLMCEMRVCTTFLFSKWYFWCARCVSAQSFYSPNDTFDVRDACLHHLSILQMILSMCEMCVCTIFLFSKWYFWCARCVSAPLFYSPNDTFDVRDACLHHFSILQMILLMCEMHVCTIFLFSKWYFWCARCVSAPSFYSPNDTFDVRDACLHHLSILQMILLMCEMLVCTTFLFSKWYFWCVRCVSAPSFYSPNDTFDVRDACLHHFSILQMIILMCKMRVCTIFLFSKWYFWCARCVSAPFFYSPNDTFDVRNACLHHFSILQMILLMCEMRVCTIFLFSKWYFWCARCVSAPFFYSPNDTFDVRDACLHHLSILQMILLMCEMRVCTIFLFSKWYFWCARCVSAPLFYSPNDNFDVRDACLHHFSILQMILLMCEMRVCTIFLFSKWYFWCARCVSAPFFYSPNDTFDVRDACLHHFSILQMILLMCEMRVCTIFLFSKWYFWCARCVSAPLFYSPNDTFDVRDACLHHLSILQMILLMCEMRVCTTFLFSKWYFRYARCVSAPLFYSPNDTLDVRDACLHHLSILQMILLMCEMRVCTIFLFSKWYFWCARCVSAPSFYSPNDTFDVRDACLHHLSILQMILLMCEMRVCTIFLFSKWYFWCARCVSVPSFYSPNDTFDVQDACLHHFSILQMILLMCEMRVCTTFLFSKWYFWCARCMSAPLFYSPNDTFDVRDACLHHFPILQMILLMCEMGICTTFLFFKWYFWYARCVSAPFFYSPNDTFDVRDACLHHFSILQMILLMCEMRVCTIFLFSKWYFWCARCVSAPSFYSPNDTFDVQDACLHHFSILQMILLMCEMRVCTTFLFSKWYFWCARCMSAPLFYSPNDTFDVRDACLHHFPILQMILLMCEMGICTTFLFFKWYFWYERCVSAPFFYSPNDTFDVRDACLHHFSILQMILLMCEMRVCTTFLFSKWYFWCARCVSAPSFYSPNDTFDVRDACLHHLSILQMILLMCEMRVCTTFLFSKWYFRYARCVSAPPFYSPNDTLDVRDACLHHLSILQMILLMCEMRVCTIFLFSKWYFWCARCVSAPSFYSPNDTFDVRDACLHHLSILQMILLMCEMHVCTIFLFSKRDGYLHHFYILQMILLICNIKTDKITFK